MFPVSPSTPSSPVGGAEGSSLEYQDAWRQSSRSKLVRWPRSFTCTIVLSTGVAKSARLTAASPESVDGDSRKSDEGDSDSVEQHDVVELFVEVFASEEGMCW